MRWKIVVTVGCALFCGHTARAGAPSRVVVFVGQEAPDTNPGVTFENVSDPVINAAGRVVFDGRLAGPGVDLTNNGALWAERASGLSLHIRWGDQAPGTAPGVSYWATGLPVQNDNGRIAFYSGLQGPGVDTVTNSNNVCLFSDGSTVESLLARRGTQAPGTSLGVSFSLFASPLMNSQGHNAFYCGLAGAGVDFTNDECIFSDAGGALALVARDGNPAPGTEVGTVFAGVNPPTLNDAGRVAFHATLGGPSVTGFNGRGIWLGDAGQLDLAVRAGMAAPDVDPPADFIVFAHPDINNADHFAFAASMAIGGSIDAANDTGIWVIGDGVTRLVAQEGSIPPGAFIGVVFDDFLNPTGIRPGLNGTGQTAFVASLTGAGVDATNDQGLWSEGGGSLELIARKGAQATGLPAGTNFAALTFGGLNNAGMVVFDATLAGPAVTVGVDDRSLWLHRPGVGLTLLARNGETVTVAPGDTRTIEDLFFVGGRGAEDGLRQCLNDAGQATFLVSFTDTTTAILATIGPDQDNDGVNDDFDNCPTTANTDQQDSDNDGIGDTCDGCPNDSSKTFPGACGCGTADADDDGDGALNCDDDCPSDPLKTVPGDCGCGNADADADGDGAADCDDECPDDADKTSAGACGCGNTDSDADGDGIADCIDNCLNNPNPDQADADADGEGDACDTESTPDGEPTPDPAPDACCGGGMPAMMPLMLLGWKRRRRRCTQ